MEQLHSDILAAWAAAGKKTTDPNIKDLLGGVNIRINIKAAFKAVYESALLYLELHAAAAGAMTDPGFVLKIGKDVYGIVRATLDALVEKMTALEYTACVVLSQYDEKSGVTREPFEKAVRDLLTLGSGDEIPWYFGLTRRRLRDARDELEAMGDFSMLMQALRKDDWLTDLNAGAFTFKPRHYVWSEKVD
jgi:hypothetical protein